MSDSWTALDSDALDAAVAAAHEHYRQARPESARLDEASRRVLPGGNTRTVLHFDPFPFRVASAAGAELVDVDGHRYVDFCGNYSAGLLGHSSMAVRQAVTGVLETGFALGATHPRELHLAERICERFPSIDQVRFTNSGTEANLMAIGTALHHTGRSGVGVFDHGYHGGVLSFGALDARSHNPLNVPHRFHVAPFDESSGLDGLFAADDLGCVLIETVQGSGGCRPASPAFLWDIRERCDEAGVVLIFDEVMTSRLAPGGAQERLGIHADLTTLGKYLGGGMTFGAFGGRADIMAGFDPALGGALTQAGTFNNNVVTMAAAIAALDQELDDERVTAVNDRGDWLRVELGAAFERAGSPFRVTGLGSMLCVHAPDDRWMELFFHAALEAGLYLSRRGFMALSFEVTDSAAQRLVDFAASWVPSPDD